MKFDFLIHHKDLIQTIAELKFSEFSYLVPEKTLDDFIEGLYRHCNTEEFPITYVALEGKNFLGTFSLRVCDLNSHSHLSPWMGSVLVPPDKRNRGIGSFLVKEAENKAKERGYNSLYLFTPNKRAWYTKLGWITIKESSLAHTPITIMQKHLHNPPFDDEHPPCL